MKQVFLAGLLTLATTGAGSAIVRSAPARLPIAPSKPNIVVFLADDHSLRDSSVYGAKDVRTPNMQRLSASGLTFNQAFVASPSCAPSRAALLTGLMPARNCAEANHSRPRQNVKLLPAYLREQGYEVVAIGKIAHYRHAKDYGFDFVSHDGYHDDECISAALKYLNERTSKKPLAFFVGTNWPHVPWPKADGSYNPTALKVPLSNVDTPQTRQMRARYYAAVTQFDTELGQLYATARKRLGPNTFFLQSSDHGAQWPFAKWNCYDEGTHVPFIVSWPGTIKAGKRTDAMVSWIDILPTLIEVAGGKPPRELDGRSFLPVLRDQKKPHRDRIFTTHSGDGNMNVYPIRSVRTSKWKYILNLHPEFAYTTHIDRGAKAEANNYWNCWQMAASTDSGAATLLKRYRERPAEELYDIVADPDEQHNLATNLAYVKVKAELRQELEAWMKAQGDKGTVFGKPRLLTDEEPVAAPQIVGKELTITCEVTPELGEGVILAQGGNRQGYALYLDAGKPVFAVRQQGQLYIASAPNAPTGSFSLEARLLKDGSMTLAVNGAVVGRGKAFGVFTAQPREGLSIGEDTRVAVGDYIAPNAHKGKVANVRVEAK